tara:strand:- start:95 stop:253 length:159 start_codon:yes stop_codon:yes gene_type:complete
MNNIINKQIGEASVVSLMPQLKIIAKHFNLKINNAKHLKIMKKVLINSIKNN